MNSDSYESHLVGLFMQMWGRLEGNNTDPATILTNAQNPFDNWFGDICGVVKYRYFLIEFKKTRDGFLEEVKVGSAKPHRTALYQHLRNDDYCRKIARVGHFAAYQAGTGILAFEPYAHSVAPRRMADELLEKTLNSSAPWAELDYAAWSLDFKKFYDALHEIDLTLHSSSPPWLFSKGLGIPEADLEQYVLCMYSHLNYHDPNPSVILLGALDTSTNELKVVTLPPFQMVKALKEKFESLRRTMAKELNNQGASKNSLSKGP